MSGALLRTVVLSLAAAAFPAGDPTSPRLIDTRTGEETTIADVAEALVRRDVVFFGELHDSADAHRDELLLTQELFARRPDLVLSFEMFERDCQGVVDDYLAARIDEATFLANARPWKNYGDAYRPLIEFAKEHQVPVVAGCIPWATAVQFGRDGQEPPRSALVARGWSAPDDAYRARFVETMKDHVKSDPKDAGKVDRMERSYRSQCLRDDTMAEAIVDALDRWKHRRPLVLHFCGSFHSDYAQGTVARVVTRMPGVSIGIVSTVQPGEGEPLDVKAERARANYVLVLPPPPKKTDEPKEGDAKKDEEKKPEAARDGR